MAVAFARTLRALNADGYRLTLAALAAAMVLLLAWCVWFFVTEITFFETSQDAYVDDEGFVIAQFDSEKLKRIQRGQTARFRPEGQLLETAGVPLQVAAVSRQPQAAEGQVRLLPPRPRSADTRSADARSADARSVATARLWPGLTGRVDVVVERATPARLVLRHIGFGDADASAAGS